jgi:hypothetical protein
MMGAVPSAASGRQATGQNFRPVIDIVTVDEESTPSEGRGEFLRRRHVAAVDGRSV